LDAVLAGVLEGRGGGGKKEERRRKEEGGGTRGAVSSKRGPTPQDGWETLRD